MSLAYEKKEGYSNFIHFIAVIAATEIYMTLRCLHVVAAKSCKACWFIAKLETP
jgi:hypothetical protein